MVEKPSEAERLYNLEIQIDRIDRWMEEQDEQLKKNKKEMEDDRDSLIEIDKKTTEAKKEITIFTLELISTIIGFLSLIIAIVVLWINRDGIDKEMLGFYAALTSAFIVLFLFFVASWILKNFPKVEGTDYKKIISYIDSNNLDIRDFVDTNNSKMRDYIDSKIKENKNK